MTFPFIKHGQEACQEPSSSPASGFQARERRHTCPLGSISLAPAAATSAPRSGAVGPEALCLSASLPLCRGRPGPSCQSVLPEKRSVRAEARLGICSPMSAADPGAHCAADSRGFCPALALGVRGKGRERTARGGHRRSNGKVPGTGSGCQICLCQWEIGISEGNTIGTNGKGLRVQGRAGRGGHD